MELARIDEAKLQAEIAPVVAQAGALTVRNGEERGYAIDFGKNIKAAQNKVHEVCDPVVEAAHAAHKAATAMRATLLDPLLAAEREIKGKVLAFDKEAERIRKAEEAQLQAEADARAAKERARLEAEAAKLKTPELKAARLEAAAAVVAPVITIAQSYDKQTGETTKTVWKARLVDKAALLKTAAEGNALAASFLAFDDKAANASARATKGAVSVPGVEFYQEKSLSLSGR